MQRTIRVLRVALPIALVAFVIIIALSWRRNTGRREKPSKCISAVRISTPSLDWTKTPPFASASFVLLLNCAVGQVTS